MYHEVTINWGSGVRRVGRQNCFVVVLFICFKIPGVCNKKFTSTPPPPPPMGVRPGVQCNYKFCCFDYFDVLRLGPEGGGGEERICIFSSPIFVAGMPFQRSDLYANKQ